MFQEFKNKCFHINNNFSHIFFFLNPLYAYSLSPIFSSHEITDKPDSNWNINPRIPCTILKDNLTKSYSMIPRIISVNYYSNGTTLYANIILSNPFNEGPNLTKFSYIYKY